MTRVLVVDDEAANREFLRVVLTAHGHAVELANHGAQALQAALHDPPDLLITDLLMPEMDGFTLLQRWRSEPLLANRPVMVYTATYTDPQDEALAIRMGADAFLVKPMEPQDLMRHVDRLLHARPQPAAPAAGAIEAAAHEDDGTLRLYNQALVRKLESKSRELEAKVAELTASQRDVEQLSRHHAVLSAINHAIVHIRDQQALLQEACTIAVERAGADIAWIGLLDAASGRIEPAGACGPAAAWLDRIGPLCTQQAPRAPAELALARGAVFICNDALAEPALAALHPEFAAGGIRAAASCPLRIGDRTAGTLTLLSRTAGFFDAHWISLLAEFADDVSFALENFEKEARRQQTEDELARLNVELEARIAARTAELTLANAELRTFSYSVSHDLRAPLAAISGFTSRTLAEPGLSETAQRLLNRVQAAAQRMAHLIDDLLQLARVSQHEIARERFDLGALAVSVVERLRERDPERAVEVSIAPNLRADADMRLVTIALENLIGNAWKFTSKRSDARIAIGREVQDGRAVFHVRDNGDGFDMAHAKSLFTPFQRLHRVDEFEGTGIGLSIVHRIIQKHGGTIWFDAQPGQGAVFHFTLTGD